MTPAQYDIGTGEITQEYDQHLGPVNTITFVDENKRFVTTSDDKTIRAWDFDIPVTIKYIAEPYMHSMPAVTIHPNSESKANFWPGFCNGAHETPFIFRLVQRNTLLRSRWTIRSSSTALTISGKRGTSDLLGTPSLDTRVKWASRQTGNGSAAVTGRVT